MTILLGHEMPLARGAWLLTLYARFYKEYLDTPGFLKPADCIWKIKEVGLKEPPAEFESPILTFSMEFSGELEEYDPEIYYEFQQILGYRP